MSHRFCSAMQTCTKFKRFHLNLFSVCYCVALFVFLTLRSLELFFATSQNNRGEYLADGKSPHLCRKFSSPPPLSLSRTSSPARTRKLSLTSPLNSRIGALDLSASSVASSPTSNYSPATSPPPTGSKAPLDLSRGLSSPEQSPGSAEDNLENPRLDLCNKLRRSIRRGIPYPQNTEAGRATPCCSSGRGCSVLSVPTALLLLPRNSSMAKS